MTPLFAIAMTDPAMLGLVVTAEGTTRPTSFLLLTAVGAIAALLHVNDSGFWLVG